MKQLTMIFIIAFFAIKILSANEYQKVVHNSVYLVHSLDIATELLIKEHDIFYAHANTVQLTGALCEVLGRLVMLNQLFDYKELISSMEEDIHFWVYIKNRIVHFIDRLSETALTPELIQLIIIQLRLWQSLIVVNVSTIND